MEFQSWIIGQIALDAFMFILLLAILKIHLRRRFSTEELESAINNSQSFLSEMKEIGVHLERNLNEKKELSNGLLFEMDRKLEDARTLYKQLEGVLSESRKFLIPARSQRINSTPNRESIEAMLEKGMTKEEVSRILNVPVGELELILKIQAHPESDSS